MTERTCYDGACQQFFQTDMATSQASQVIVPPAGWVAVLFQPLIENGRLYNKYLCPEHAGGLNAGMGRN